MPDRGELLVARRTVNLQAKTVGDEQRANLFHTRCMVQGKVCSLVIDGGSCTNAASETMVEKLDLKIMKTPTTYKLQWLNDEGELEVKHQVKIPPIGKYDDEILCDVYQWMLDTYCLEDLGNPIEEVFMMSSQTGKEDCLSSFNTATSPSRSDSFEEEQSFIRIQE